MPSHRYVSSSHDSGFYSNPFVCVRVLNPEQFFGKPFAEFPVEPKDVLSRGSLPLLVFALINAPLKLDVGNCFTLQRSASWLCRIILRQRTINIARMGIVALDEIRIVAVHRADKFAHGPLHGGIQISCQCTGL